MIDRRALIAGTGASAITMALPARAADDHGGLFIAFDKQSKNIAEVHITIWLPPGYEASKGRYGVVYMNDGQNVFDPKRSGFNKVWAADQSAMRLMDAGQSNGFIIVGVDHPGENRYRQYFPTPMLDLVAPDVRDDLVEFGATGITSDAYLKFLAEELKPVIDAHFRTNPDSTHTAIVGSSMGGLISLYAVTAMPEIFGRAGAVSTHLPLAGPEWSTEKQASIKSAWDTYVSEKLGKPKGRRIWFDHGTETLDAHYAPYQQALDKSLVANGWREGRDFSSRVYTGAPHEENAWAARMDDIFGWLLKDWK